MKKEEKKKKNTKPKNKNLKKILKPVQIKKETAPMDHSLGSAQQQIKKSKASSLQLNPQKEDSITQETGQVSDFDIADILLEQEEPQIQENLEETVGIQPVIKRETQDNFAYAGKNKSVSYNPGSSNTNSNNINYSGTNQPSADPYMGTNQAGGAYDDTSQQRYNTIMQQSLTNDERIGEIRDTSSSGLESEFRKKGKNQTFQMASDERY